MAQLVTGKHSVVTTSDRLVSADRLPVVKQGVGKIRPLGAALT